MPTYVYRRADGSTFELEQRISAPALTTDPETGQPVQRVISGAGLVFKGSGFYLTDYARKGGGTDKAEATADPKPATTAAQKTEPKGAASPAAATPAEAKATPAASGSSDAKG